MYPLIFNVQYHQQKNPSNLDPRDILVLDSTSSKTQKVLSAIKYLGGFTIRQTGFMAVGGMLVVGCTLRFLRNRRKRLRDERASSAGFEAHSGSKTDACTQTDPLPDPVLREEVAPGHQDVSLEESDAEKLGEGGRNLSNVSAVSNSYKQPECNCAAARESVKQASSPHLHGNVSAFLALLALHKTLMCEASISARQDKDHLQYTSCQSETRSLSTDVGKEEHAAFVDSSTGEGAKTSELLRPTQVACSPKENDFTAGSRFGIPVRNPTPAPPVKARPNPFNIRDNRDRATRPCASGRQNKVDTVLKGGSPEPRGPSSNRKHRPQDGPSSVRTSSLGISSQDVRNLPQSPPKEAIPRTVEQRSIEHDGKIGFRSQARSVKGAFSQRGKPRRRGSGRKHIPRRPYVDLDNPKPIAP